MKSRETLIRLKRFQVDEKRRQVAQIEQMVAEFERMATDLDREIKAEESRAGITDTSHFAYPTYARAAMVRRDNLRGSANDLKVKLEAAQAALAEAFEDLKKVEILDDRERATERALEAQREQAEMDRIGLARR
jgi:flagellar protein FliJ